jgi:hypothetical protein
MSNMKLRFVAILGIAAMSLAAQSTSGKPDSGDWKGDLTGVWQGPYTPDLTRGTGAVLTPWGQDKFNRFDGKMDPCLPVGVTRQANAPDPIEIVQTPKRVVILYESWAVFRSIPTDGIDHSISPDPTWLGTSVGHWERGGANGENDTLVIDVTKLNDKTALDTNGHPHSDQLHLTERLRRTGPATMSYEVTVDDPKAYTQPWKQSRVFRLKPGIELMEYVCLENERDRSHLLGIK